MPHTGQRDQRGVRQRAQVVGGVGHGNEGVLVAPQQQGRRLDVAQQGYRVDQHRLLQAGQQGLAAAGCTHEVVVLRGHGVCQHRRVAIGRGQVHAQHGAGQYIAHQAHDGRYVRCLAVGRSRACESVGRQQHEPPDPLRMLCSEGPGHAPPDRVPHEVGPGDPALVQQGLHQGHRAGIAVVALRVGLTQAAAGQIEAYHPVRAGQRQSPGFPGVQAGPEAVDHQDGRRIFRAGVAHVQPLPGHLHLVGGCVQVQGLEGRAVPVGCPQQEGKQHGKQHGDNSCDTAFHGRFCSSWRAASRSAGVSMSVTQPMSSSSSR